MFDRIRQITDDELKTIDRDSLMELIRNMEAVMILGSQPAQAVAEFIEKINLDISLRLITCKLLEKRINGVMELKEAVERSPPLCCLLHLPLFLTFFLCCFSFVHSFFIHFFFCFSCSRLHSPARSLFVCYHSPGSSAKRFRCTLTDIK